MSRHAFDDFSFLPTVDSTEEEIVEREELRQAQQHSPQPEIVEPEYPVVAEPTHAEEPVYEEHFHEEPVMEAPAHEVVAEAAPEPPFFVQVPRPLAKVPAFEAGTSHLAPRDEEDSLALQKELGTPVAKVQAQQPQALSNQESGVTMLISRAPKAVRVSKEADAKPAAVIVAPALPSSDAASYYESKEGTEVLPDKEAKPFIAPKPAPEEPLDPEEAKKQRWQKLADKVGLRTACTRSYPPTSPRRA